MLAELPEFDPSLSPDEVRENGNARRPPRSGNQDVTTEDRLVPAPHGGIPARLYTPPGGAAPRGLLVYFHGGGFVVGDLESHDGVCRDLAAGAEVAVLAVDYRLAPEHPFPAAVEDAWTALSWAKANAGSLGADPGRVAVGGDSAGGNLAAVAALMARDEGLPLSLQLLVYPVTDFSRRRPSYEENREGYFLGATAMDWFEGHYGPARDDWRASPILAADHRNVAPAVVMTCEYDPLRDEGDDYAAALRAAGVEVTHRRYPGLIHGVLGMGAVVPAAGALMTESCTALRAAVGTPAGED